MDQKSVCDAKIQSASPDHSVLNAQLKYTKQHELPFMCHLSNRALHRGIRVSQGSQSFCIPTFSVPQISAKGTATFL